MLSTLIVLLPCMMCLVWVITAFGRKNKGHREYSFGALMILFTVYFYTSATFLQGDSDYAILSISEPLSRVIVPMVFPACYLYIRSIMGSRQNAAWCMVYFIPSVMMASVVIMLWVAIGADGISRFIEARDSMVISGAPADQLPQGFSGVLFVVYNFCCSTGFIVLLLASALALSIYTFYKLYKNGFNASHIFAFFGNHDSNRSNVIGFLVLLLAICCACNFLFASSFLLGKKVFALLFFLIQGMILYILGWMEMFFKSENVTWRNAADPVATITQAASAANVETVKQTAEDQESESLYAKLLASFNEMMEKDKCYLNPSITVESIAQQLGTNRVYISRVINRTYNMTFPEYVNGKRLETAKQMLLEDPEAVLEYVALKSGFSGLSQFSRKFKEMTGMSPRAWQALQNKKQ